MLIVERLEKIHLSYFNIPNSRLTKPRIATKEYRWTCNRVRSGDYVIMFAVPIQSARPIGIWACLGTASVCSPPVQSVSCTVIPLGISYDSAIGFSLGVWADSFRKIGRALYLSVLSSLTSHFRELKDSLFVRQDLDSPPMLLVVEQQLDRVRHAL